MNKFRVITCLDRAGLLPANGSTLKPETHSSARCQENGGKRIINNNKLNHEEEYKNIC